MFERAKEGFAGAGTPTKEYILTRISRSTGSNVDALEAGYNSNIVLTNTPKPNARKATSGVKMGVNVIPLLSALKPSATTFDKTSILSES